MAEIFVYSGGVGDAGLGVPQFIATVRLLPSAPLMLSAAGALVPNDGTKPVIGFAPIGGVAPGQAFSPIGLDIVNVNTAAPYTAGAVYYLQPAGLLSTVVSAHYAGTAISSSVLVNVPGTAANVAANNATPPPIDPLLLDEGPAAAANKILTQASFTSEPAVTDTINTAGAAGDITMRAKPHGIHFVLSLTALPTNDFADIFYQLPAANAYLPCLQVFTDDTGKIGGTVVVFNGSFRLIRVVGAAAPISSYGFVQYE